MRGSRRLYLQVYLAFVGIVLLFAALSAVLFLVTRDALFEAPWRDGLVQTVSEALPPAEQGREAAQAALQHFASRFEVALLLLDRDGMPIARVGAIAPPRGRLRPGWRHGRGGPQLVLPLNDGRTLVAQQMHHRGEWWPWLLLALVLAIAIGAHPLARRITRRLERLQVAVEGLGAGNLATRVPVEGRDEVARLAQSFNVAAERIERLVGSQRSMLANASHELRSPLTRLRLAIELLGDGADQRLADEMRRDIGELDGLVEEILLFSRIEASDELPRRQALDLLALVAEEAARVGAEVDGTATSVVGDPVWLRRLARNLLENARRHAPESAVRVVLGARDGMALLVVEDDGPGIEQAERERIFEPFYRSSGRAEGEGGGVGLGLALVRQIARRHGGDARCEPGAAGGSRFEVTLAKA